MRRMRLGPTKTHAHRTVALPRFLREMINEHLSDPVSLASGSGPDALVFASPSGEPMRHNLFYKRTFKPAVRRALPHKAGFRFHDLRHTCASLLAAQGAHPKLVQERLGHSSIAITLDRYSHLFPSAEEALVDALDAARAGATLTSNVAELRAAGKGS
jgi:integrase